MKKPTNDYKKFLAFSLIILASLLGVVILIGMLLGKNGKKLELSIVSNNSQKNGPNTAPNQVKEAQMPSTTPQPSATPTPEPTATPTPTPAPAVTQVNVYGIDYSDGRAIDFVTSVKFSVYDAKGKLVATKTSEASYEKVASGALDTPDAIFYLQAGTYTIKGETDTKVGTAQKTVEILEYLQGAPVAMYTKPGKITGKLFVDANSDNKYDPNDKLLADQPIYAYFFASNDKVFLGATTKTNSAGEFELTIDKYAGTYQLQTDANLPYAYYKNFRTEVQAGQTVSQDIMLWPR
ncbi:MAG: hypothetical protein ACOZAN_02805 [Patescibacteria group bacterium]